MSTFSRTHQTYASRMMLLLLLATMSIINSVDAANSQALDLVIVVNSTDKNLVLSKQQIRHIYMGGALSRQFKAVNLPPGNPLRADFNTKVVGLTESRVQAYWAQMKFTGRSQPPVELLSIQAVIEYLQQVENSVAYLPADTKLPNELTVISFAKNAI
ncbi:hypothetical protein [Pseudoalteromonas sp.]|jgi:hypothetical protein|uniref:hypothetical protein n=1 Tax=Pseudoalteromonas sp. TaxID=53249 RepID=UPI003565BFC5